MVICNKYTRFVNLSQSNTVTNITDVTGYNWKEVKVWTNFWPYTVCRGLMKILINNSYLVKNESGIHIRVCLDVENLHWINTYMYKGWSGGNYHDHWSSSDKWSCTAQQVWLKINNLDVHLFPPTLRWMTSPGIEKC